MALRWDVTHLTSGVVVVLTEQALSILVIVALALVGVLLVACVLLFVKLRALRRSYADVLDPDNTEDVFHALSRHAGELDQLRDDIAVVHGNTEHLRDLLRNTLSRIGVVRYDAFDDMGGALSFSAALLDENADGVVISAINGRTETRTYAKPIRNGASEYNLSPEETTALQHALQGKKGETAPPPSSRRRRRAAAS